MRTNKALKQVLRIAVFSIITVGWVGCEDEIPAKKNAIVGSWYFESVDTPLKMSFDIVQKGDFISIENAVVEHPSLTNPDTDCHVTLWDKFESGQGYGRIEIASHRQEYYTVNLIYNLINDGGDLEVYDMLINMPDGFQGLYGQVLKRK
jgi:hypothetical protein